MAPLLARTGRHRQRYEGRFRLVAGCIPYRFIKNVDSVTIMAEQKLQVLMISSPNRDDLVFPKGGWEDDESKGEAASREALEEAGVKGILYENKELGYWEFRSKSRENSCSTEGSCRVYMFPLEVTEELESWPEQSSHGRKWLSVEEAFRLSRYDWMRRALEEFLRAFPSGRQHKLMEDAPTSAHEETEHQIPLSCHEFSPTPSASTSPINALC